MHLFSGINAVVYDWNASACARETASLNWKSNSMVFISRETCVLIRQMQWTEYGSDGKDPNVMSVPGSSGKVDTILLCFHHEAFRTVVFRRVPLSNGGWGRGRKLFGIEICWLAGLVLVLVFRPYPHPHLSTLSAKRGLLIRRQFPSA